MTTSRISGFYNLTLDQRRAKLAESANLAPEDLAAYSLNGGLSAEAADHMIENVIGTYALPLGIGLEFSGQRQGCARSDGNRRTVGGGRRLLHGQTGPRRRRIPGHDH